MTHTQPEIFLQWNTRSLVSNWGEFKNYVLYNKPLIAAIQETHFIDSDSDNYNFNIPDYCLYLNNINISPRQGGVAIYISNKLLHHQINLDTTLNAVGTKIKIAQRDLTVLSVYLSPSHPITPDEISKLFTQITPPYLILGDFNAHNRAWGCNNNNTRGNQLLDIMNNLDLIHLNNLIPTHTQNVNGNITYSVIDLGISDPQTATLFTQCVGNDTLFSDHFPIHYILETPSGQTNFNFLPRWNFNKADWNSFQSHIDETLTTHHPPDINTFLNTILSSAQQNIPLTRPTTRKHNAPWWNTECNRAVALRRRALRAFQRCICEDHWVEARKARSEAKHIINKAKTQGWSTFSNNFNRFTPLSKIWSLIKCFSNKRSTHYKIPHLHVNNIHYTIPLEVATQFATHYANISSSQQYSQQVTNILNTTLNKLSFSSNNTQQYNSPFTIHELSSSITKCGNTSVGPDQIAYAFFKNLTATGLTYFLTSLNQIWQDSSFPPSWRSSTLIPILKPRKPPDNPSSYRPISLTSCASKVMERMINIRLRTYLESNKYLSPYQNGFRPGRSTADSLLQLIDQVQRGFQTKHVTIALFLDLKAAFDKVNKTALLIKLHKIGIRGRLANFTQEFLKDRTFQVRCGNTYSPTYTQDHGLPQGSVLSPTLFLIMINDMFEDISKISPHIKYSLFADDIAIWFTHPCVDRAHTFIQLALTHVQAWCNAWGLQISPSKSAGLVFTNQPVFLTPRLPLMINNETIKYVKQYKYLGITLNQNLSFTAHFDDLRQRCSRRLNIMKCITGKEWGSDRHTLLQLYKSIIRPILDYNCFLFDTIAPPNKIKKLQTIQNEALRIATGALRTSNTYNLHIETNIPLLSQRRKYQLLRFYAKASTRPNDPTYITLTKTHTNTNLTRKQNKHPTFNTIIERSKTSFETQPFNIIPAPKYRAHWLDTPPKTHFLFPESKDQITPIEINSIFNKFISEHNDYTFIYTDGSVKDGKTGVGITSATFNKSNRLSNLHSIFTAELQGIVSAIYQILHLNIDKSVIFTDSSSSILAISSPEFSTHPLVSKIKCLLNRINNTKQIQFMWVPGHSGITGNETADTLAKNSLLLQERNHLASPLDDVYNHIHSCFRKLIQKEWDENPHYHLHPIKPKTKHTLTCHQDTRLKERTLARLRIGQTFLTHYHIFGNLPPPECQKCNNNTRYTIKHFLIDCPHLHHHRQDMLHYINQQNLTFNLPTLLGDDHPTLIDLLFKFLGRTQLIKNI